MTFRSEKNGKMFPAHTVGTALASTVGTEGQRTRQKDVNSLRTFQGASSLQDPHQRLLSPVHRQGEETPEPARHRLLHAGQKLKA